MEMNNETPLVSVIMPAYNAADFIEEAIASVRAQTIEEWELFVIDDGSRDQSYELALSFGQIDPRIKVLRNKENMGVSKTRNRGIAMASGKYIAFLDSDDVWYPEKLQRQLEVLHSTNAAITYCAYEIIGPSGENVKPDYLVPPMVTYQVLLKQNYIQCSAMLIKAELVKKYLFNTEYYHEDYILSLDILKEGEIAAGCTELLLRWRYVANSRSFDKKRSAANRWKIYRNYLKLPFVHCVWLFIAYAIGGIKKYGLWKK